MRAILVSVILYLAACFTFAQGDLQFDQVVLLEIEGGGSPYISPTYTVPAGKVWKIESAGATTSSFEIHKINNTQVDMAIHTSGSFNHGENLPLWLPEGTTISFYEADTSPDEGGIVSIIQFNVN